MPSFSNPASAPTPIPVHSFRLILQWEAKRSHKIPKESSLSPPPLRRITKDLLGERLSDLLEPEKSTGRCQRATKDHEKVPRIDRNQPESTATGQDYDEWWASRSKISFKSEGRRWVDTDDAESEPFGAFDQLDGEDVHFLDAFLQFVLRRCGHRVHVLVTSVVVTHWERAVNCSVTWT